MRKPYAVMHIGDLHCGSIFGAVHSKKFYYGEEDCPSIYTASALQSAILRHLQGPVMGKFIELSKNYTMALEVGGDDVDGALHHNTTQTFGTDADAIDIAEQVILPFVSKIKDPRDLIFLKGTSAHTGHCSMNDDAVAKRFGRRARWEVDRSFDGVLYNFRHPTSTSRIEARRGSAMLVIAHDVETQRLRERKPVPDVTVRHHVHLFDAIRYQAKGVDMTVINMPSLQACTEFGEGMVLRKFDVGVVFSIPSERIVIPVLA